MQNQETETPIVDEAVENEQETATAEFEDGVENEAETKKEDKPNAEEEKRIKEQKERNRKAYETRQRKKEEAIKKQAYLDGIKKATKGVNPYTNAPIEDELDLEEYELMKKLDDDGKDPIADYSQALKEKQKQAQKQAKEEEEKQQAEKSRLDADINEFIDKYGEELAEELSNNKDFDEFSKGLYGETPKLATLYEKFKAFNELVEKRAEELANEKEALRMSSTGKIGKQETPPTSIADMSDEEFRKHFNEQKQRY